MDGHFYSVFKSEVLEMEQPLHCYSPQISMMEEERRKK